MDPHRLMVNAAGWPAWPQYGADENIAVSRVIASNQLSAASEVLAFEEEYSEYIGSQFALGLGNATQGLHLALAALNIGVGDEVIVTPYSWISSASCVLMQNSVPIFCDIESESLGLDPLAVEAAITERTKAIILVHMFGYPARVREIADIARRHGVALIEDASHVHGALVGDRRLGTFGDVSVLSLHQRKSLSVGDGGVVCTDNPEIFEKIRRLRSFGHEELSYNYRMTEFAAALGRVGLLKLDADNEIRSGNAELLRTLLSDCGGLSVRMPRTDEVGVFHAVLLEVHRDIPAIDKRLAWLQELGIPVRKTWAPLHKHPHFNPSSPPARGLPWEHPSYFGGRKFVPYGDQVYPVAEHYCPNRILELYVHPPAGDAQMRLAAQHLREAFSA